MRSLKMGLDYFPVDVDFFNDEKIEFVSAKHGVLAELVAVKLLTRIYRHGYFIKWDEDAKYLYAKKFGEGISHEFLTSVVEDLNRKDFFSREKYEKYGVLTSRGIQKRYLKAVSRRKETEIFTQYLLLPTEDVASLNPNVNIKDLNVDMMSTETPGNTNTGTQSKGKESKEKNTPPIVPPLQKKSKATKSKKPKTPVPEKFIPTNAQTQWAKEHGFTGNLSKETDKFLNHHGSLDNRFADWTRAWRNWILKAVEFQKDSSRGGNGGGILASDKGVVCRDCNEPADFLIDGVCEKCKAGYAATITSFRKGAPWEIENR